ncbi:LysR family transcriptional regulator [Paenibacillus soyae]|uniref:LysR family transcriptional regulator n=1 Tax=Paenibacillus soyae TaxID=2969249 RepID=A0A9X2S8Z3_9BACL|nr:LysR family transcriptional regulator [Paenibacillus soyae]MCR2804606.1 LysR family transcriptional regulator [Paenibacillus soyae]
MNTEFLAGFIQAAELKSITKASEAMHISHTALSKQLRTLETQFDVRLFVRSSHGVELTDAGKILYASSKRLLDQVAELEHQLTPYRIGRRLKIASVPDIAMKYLVAALPMLQEQGHEVEIVYRQSTKEVYEMLIEGEADICVAERFGTHPSIWTGELGREPLHVVMPKDHPLSSLESVTLTELSRHPLVLYSKGCTIRAALTQMFGGSQESMHIKTEVGFSEVILGYVANGSGVTVLPEGFMAAVFADQLVYRPLDHPDAHRSIAVASLNRAKGQRFLRLIG